ncbi:MAG: Glu/Leu/Phe/Val dehydrogenase [Candidatus Dadabacteria bacterium]|nr:MAG: Glu/Leu/Phe/Val dehydrogenase [Candidatus Dadabacteria bacterium]
MECLKQMQKRDHEQVVFFNYPSVGLKAIVAIHNTVLGPALGGCRLRQYESEDQALDDVLRLSEGMTYKSSLAGLDLGGGKSCIFGDTTALTGKAREELFLKFGHCLNYLDGRYITAEDMGTSVEDVNIMRRVTKWAAGYDREAGGSGDPSPWTALGVFRAIEAVVRKVFNGDSLAGKKVAIQGVGHVGFYLARYLKKEGAKLTVCDTREEKIKRITSEVECDVVDVDSIYDVDCDVFAPCAIGQTINEETLPRLKCKIICGAANNQLSGPEVYSTIQEKGLVYCPDFVVNAGGVISVAGEYLENGWNEGWVRKKVEAIANTTLKVLEQSEKRGRFTEPVAIELAKERIKEKEQRSS